MRCTVVVGLTTVLGCLMVNGQLAFAAPRTPLGDLWAGTRLQVHAALSMNGVPIARSEAVPVIVEQVYRWQLVPETLLRYFTLRAGEARLRLRLQNRGNGWDSVELHLTRTESPDRSPWRVELWENPPTSRNRFLGRRLDNGITSPLPPGGAATVLLFLQPPANLATDGIVLQIGGRSVGGGTPTATWDYGVGIERNRVPVATGTGWYNFELLTPLSSWDGYIWWVAGSGGDIRLFRSRQPMSRTSGYAPFAQANLRQLGGTFSGSGSFASGKCFIGRTDGRIGFFAVPSASETVVDINFSLLNQPPGALLATGSPIVSDGESIIYVTSSGQLARFRISDGVWQFHTPNAPIVRLFAVGEWILTEHSNATLSLWRRGTPMGIHIPLPQGVSGVVGFEGLPNSLAVIVAHGTRVSLYRADIQQWVWSQTAGGASVVSNPAYDPNTQAVYCITQDGLLWGYNALDGTVLLHYPNPLYRRATSISQARLSVLTRADRSVSYLYAVTRRSDENTARFWAVHAAFPYNRFIRDLSLGTAPRLLGVTPLGNTVNDVVLVWNWAAVEGNSWAPVFHFFDLQ